MKMNESTETVVLLCVCVCVCVSDRSFMLFSYFNLLFHPPSIIYKSMFNQIQSTILVEMRRRHQQRRKHVIWVVYFFLMNWQLSNLQSEVKATETLLLFLFL